MYYNNIHLDRIKKYIRIRKKISFDIDNMYDFISTKLCT